jgi:putative transposase
MPRNARVVAVGAPHHITQRGNNRQTVFLVDEDRRFYLETFREDSRRYGLRVLGYCLITNHVHLVAVPERENTLARAMQRTHSRYAQRFNRPYGRSGHLWQNRFFSCALDRDHLVTALAYVDLNPVRAGLAGSGEQYPWSSARAHVSGVDVASLVDIAAWREVRGVGDWGDMLSGPPDEDECRALRQATLTGLPLGEAEFVKGMEKEAGRRLTPGRVGRPPRQRRAAG